MAASRFDVPTRGGLSRVPARRHRAKHLRGHRGLSDVDARDILENPGEVQLPLVARAERRAPADRQSQGQIGGSCGLSRAR